MFATLDEAIAASRAAVSGVVTGDPAPIHALFAETDDVTLGNPFGPFVVGRAEVVATTAAAAARYRDGELGEFELHARHEVDGLGCVVETERFSARLGDSEERTAVSLRVTSIYRRDHTGWRLVHRHADPITTSRGTESLQTG